VTGEDRTCLVVALERDRRSETVRGLRGDARDERFRAIDIHAGAFAGFVLIVTLVVLALTRGDDIDPYGQLLAVAGVSYVVALAFMHLAGLTALRLAPIRKSEVRAPPRDRPA
jgi:hypothetical protein